MNIVTNMSPTVSAANHSNDGYSNIIQESYEFFADQGINMMSDCKDILVEDTLFDNYKNHLCGGLDLSESVQLDQIFSNSRLGILQESSISGISPLAGLVMPTIRKLWLKVAMKNAIPTETAKIPTFTISYFKPYIKEADGTKHFIPEDIRDDEERKKIAEKKALVKEFIKLPTEDGLVTLFDGTADTDGVYTFTATKDATNTAIEDVNILEASGGVIAGSDTLDPVMRIDKVAIQTKAASGNAAAEYAVVKTDIKLSHESKFYSPVSYTDEAGKEYKDVILGSVNLVNGLVEVTSMKGLVEYVTIDGAISSETNRNSQSVGFDIDRKNITIGTGAHINAPLPIEMVQDSLALYNVDATLEVVDLMSNVVAQKLEYQIIDFFNDSFNKHYEPDFVGYFDVKPAAGFAGTPLAWREEIKRIIDYKATELKDQSAFTNGYFVIFGHPNDMQIIPNVSWTFNHTTDEKGGVAVDYDLGAYSGLHKYNLVSSFQVPQGEIHMFFVPESDKYMTYKYYPYTFNIERGYLDPQNPNVPSIMVTKRHTIEEFIPCATKIKILHNDGSLINNYALN